MHRILPSLSVTKHAQCHTSMSKYTDMPIINNLPCFVTVKQGKIRHNGIPYMYQGLPVYLEDGIYGLKRSHGLKWSQGHDDDTILWYPPKYRSTRSMSDTNLRNHRNTKTSTCMCTTHIYSHKTR